MDRNGASCNQRSTANHGFMLFSASKHCLGNCWVESGYGARYKSPGHGASLRKDGGGWALQDKTENVVAKVTPTPATDHKRS